MDQSNDCLQKDAVPTESFEVVRQQEEATGVSLQSPEMLLAQNSTSTSYTFNECHGVQLGTVFRIGNMAEVGVRNAAAVRQHSGHDESAYAKTPTIKVGSMTVRVQFWHYICNLQEMMESKQPMSPGKDRCYSTIASLRSNKIKKYFPFNSSSAWLFIIELRNEVAWSDYQTSYRPNVCWSVSKYFR